MLNGLLSGILWGLDTTILGITLAMTPFVSNEQVIFIAPFISTFLHDFFSSIWMSIYMCFKGQLLTTLKKTKTRSGHFIMLAALMGGPVGMTGYVLAIKYIGPSYTAIISSLYPAIGAILSYIFLKERMKPVSIFGLTLSVLGISILGYAPGGHTENFFLGFVFALMCVIGWASEAVICAYGMSEEEVSPEQSLQLRQLTSAVTYAFILIPLLKGISTTLTISVTWASVVILITALFGTASYVCYYQAIHNTGSTKAMSLNITYSAWAVLFGVILLGQPLSFKSITCAIIIMLGSILAAGDINELMSKVPQNN